MFRDLNGNGVQDAGEPGIADVDITIVGTTAGASHSGGFTIQTGPTGAYAFTGLLPGGYTIMVDTADPDMDPAFVSTTGGDLQTQTVTADQHVTVIDFGYAVPVSIGDFVFDDVNGDGAQAGDAGLGGVTLELTGGSLPGPVTITTGAGTGAYSFDGLLPGTYTVTVTGGLPAGSFSTTGGDAQTITVTSGAGDDTVDFGYAQPGTIGDQVYIDNDGDGAFHRC